MNYFQPVFSCIFIGCLAVSGYGQDRPLGSTATMDQLTKKSPVVTEDAAPDWTELTISAAKEPVPSLKYRFWPHPNDLKAGRAETHFYRALILYREIDREVRQQAESEFLENFEKADSQDVEEYLRLAATTIEELEALSLSTDQSWDLGVRNRLGLAWYSILLPDVQDARALARLLSVRAEYQLRQKDFEGFAQTMQTCFRLAGFVGQGEIIVQQLVGVAIEGSFLQLVEKAISTPNCPNFYWALASIPRPLCDFRRSFEFEATLLVRAFPFLEEARDGKLSDDQWRQKLMTAGEDVRELSNASLTLMVPMGLLLGSQAQADAAKQRLLEIGYTSADLDDRGRVELIALQTYVELLTIQDNMIKAAFLPPHKSQGVLERSEAVFERMTSNNGEPSLALIIAGLLLPAQRQALHAGYRTDFNLKRLLTIESIRDYLAHPSGRFPKTLDQLTRLPAFDDPYTGDALDYELDDSVNPPQAIIRAPEELLWPKIQKTILTVRP